MLDDEREDDEGQLDLPGFMDRIEVLWELDNGDMFWWPAQVLTLTQVFAEELLAVGRILYEKRPGFDKQMSDVEFILGQLLRPKRITRKHSDQNVNSWRLVVSSKNDSDANDANWEEDQPRDSPMDGRKRARTVLQKGVSHTPATRAGRDRSMDLSKTGSEPSHLGVNRLEELEKGMSMCLQRICSLEIATELQHMSNIKGMNQDYHKTVLHFLRRAILRQLQRPFKRSCTGSGVVDGGHTAGAVSARVDCSLRDFASVAGDLSGTEHGVSFSPSLSAIQNRSLAMKESHITFSTMRQLCMWLGINEFADKEAMLLREGSSGSGSESMLRVLGGIVEPKKDIGTGEVWYLIGRSILNACDEDKSKILYRRSTGWDSQNDKFIHALEVSQFSHCPVLMPPCNEVPSERRSGTFHITWRRAVDLSRRLWTLDASREEEEGLGELQIFLPAVFFYYPNVCEEVDKCITTEFCKELLH